MEYHEIGDRFEYDGVMLEVVEGYGGLKTDCVGCAFANYTLCLGNLCTPSNRKDGKNIYYKLVEQCKTKDMEQNIKTDNVNHPKHYTWLKDLCGIEVIYITRHMGFCLGNAVNYILIAGHKKDASLTDIDKQVEDLNKAIWYINDEIKRITELNRKENVNL